jgi:hypothetical protein
MGRQGLWPHRRRCLLIQRPHKSAGHHALRCNAPRCLQAQQHRHDHHNDDALKPSQSIADCGAAEPLKKQAAIAKASGISTSSGQARMTQAHACTCTCMCTCMQANAHACKHANTCILVVLHWLSLSTEVLVGRVCGGYVLASCPLCLE